MEILSDTTFKGKVNINSTLSVGNNFILDPTTGISEFGVFVGNSHIRTGSLETKNISVSDDVVFGGNVTLSANKHLSLSNSNNTYKCVEIVALSDSGSLGFFFYTSGGRSGCFYISPTSDTGRRLLDERDLCGKIMSIKFPINFDVSADCSKFIVPGQNRYYSYDSKVHSAQMLRTSTIEFGDSNCLVFQPIMADIYVDKKLRSVLVQKSTSFVIGAADGYQIDVVYS